MISEGEAPPPSSEGRLGSTLERSGVSGTAGSGPGIKLQEEKPTSVHESETPSGERMGCLVPHSFICSLTRVYIHPLVHSFFYQSLRGWI